MTFSVIVPTYNRKDILRECLDRLICQDYPKADYEIIVVDDGSADGTGEMIKNEFMPYGNVKYIYHENRGMYEAWNGGAREACMETLVLTDNDCLAPKDFLASISGCFSRHPDMSACIGHMIPVFRDGIFSPLSKYYEKCYRSGPANERIFSEPEPSAILHSDCAAVKKNEFMKTGGFDEKIGKFSCGADVDMGLRLLKAGNRLCDSKMIYVYHYQRTSVTKIITRYFRFGFVETLNYKRHFAGRLVFFPPSGEPKSLSSGNITGTLKIFGTLEIFTFFFILSLFYPKIGLLLAVLYFLQGYLFAKVKPDNMYVFLLHKIYVYLIQAAVLFGNITGSIKNKVFCV
jgi:GT2 family glycosyltransferase